MDDPTTDFKDLLTDDAPVDQTDKQGPYSIQDLREMLSDGKRHWGKAHSKYTERLAFSHGVPEKQWDAEALALRKLSKRPALQYPIVSAFIRPTVNAVKEAPPEINVFPISDATKQDAQLVSGLFRYLQVKSQAPRAYLYALDHAMRASISGFRITPRKVRRKVDIEIKPLMDMSKVYIDPAAQALDYADAQWVIVESEMSERDYKRDFPDGKATAHDGWMTVYEAWCLEDLPEQEPDDLFPDEDEDSPAVKLHMYVFEESGILDYVGDYPGTILPFFFLTGERVDLNNETELYCVTDDLIAPQRTLNWLESEAIASMASATKAQWLVDDDALGDFEEDFENSATDPVSVLHKKPGSEVKQIEPPPPPTGFIELSNQNIERARLITGIYPDPSLQAKADAPSGKAIKQQQMGSGIAMFHYVDGLNNLLARAGDCLLEMAIKYFNNDELRISMGADGQPTIVSFGPTEVPGVKNLDLAKCRLGCTFSSGPAYASQREALISQIMELGASHPQVMSVLIDWVVGQANLPGSEEIVDRLRATLPPEIQAVIQQHKQGDPEVQMAAMRTQLQELTKKGQALQQMLQKVTEALNKTREQLELEQKASQSDNQTKLQIAQIDAQVRETIDQRSNATKLQIDHNSNATKLAIEQIKATAFPDENGDRA